MQKMSLMYEVVPKIRGVSKIFFRKPGFLKQNMIAEHCSDLIGMKQINSHSYQVVPKNTRWFQNFLQETRLSEAKYDHRTLLGPDWEEKNNSQLYHVVPKILNEYSLQDTADGQGTLLGPCRDKILGSPKIPYGSIIYGLKMVSLVKKNIREHY